MHNNVQFCSLVFIGYPFFQSFFQDFEMTKVDKFAFNILIKYALSLLPYTMHLLQENYSYVHVAHNLAMSHYCSS